ncbi:MAG: ATP-binding protein [Deltaproteobacteria bacterium]|nr:ATP-binding protein [Deltaproteobacteria bacterium]
MDRYEDLPPRADAMVASMRAIGYDLAMAIADLIDNSIFAGAGNIWIKYHWEGSGSWIYILDDGHGMSEEKLKEAMRLGSQSPSEERDPKDLGRFGLGLKTASFSQCRVITVYTKTPEGATSLRCWDLDHVEETQRWELDTIPPKDTESILANLDELPHGTMVLWQGLDRVVEADDPDDEEGMRTFYNKFLAVQRYLEMVFHRYLSPPANLKITLGTAELKPWDPYLRNNPFTQELASERYEDGTVRIVPFVLPHVSKRTDTESASGAGPKGWNAQQGFYLYRNKRMIVPGGYLDFGIVPEEHYKLARIMVDIDNRMDHEWGIDVRKATASPPDRLRAEFEKVAKATRKVAADVYRARMGTVRTTRRRSTSEVWKRMRRGDKIVYEINKRNEVVKEILDEISPPASWTNKLFHVIETTVPHRLIVMDNSEMEDCHVDLPPEVNMPSQELIDLCIEFYKRHRNGGRAHEVAIDLTLAVEPFNTHPAYRAALDSLNRECDDNGQDS